MAGQLRVLASLVPRHQFQHPHRCGQGLQAMQGQGAAGGLGGEKEQPIQVLPRHGLEQREQGAHRLADAGGRLGQQAAADAGGLVDGFRQRPLAVAEVGMGKGQGRQRLIPRGAMGQLLARPGEKARALQGEVLSQIGRRPGFGKDGLGATADVEIDQRQGQPRQLAGLAEQMAIDLGLGPMQVTMVAGLAVQAAPVGLDLFQAIGSGVEAIGATAHLQVLEVALQADLALIAGTAPRRHPLVAFDTFQGGGRRGEPEIQVAGLGGEFAEGANGDAIAHAEVAATCHCTWQTLTGMSWAAKKSSQRRWLSCRRSPGPLTSIIR